MGEFKQYSLLFRKGADFLVFTTFPQDVTGVMEQEIRHVLQESREKWGLEAEIRSREFKATKSLRQALDIIVGV